MLARVRVVPAQRTGGLSNACTAHAQHVGRELMRDVELIGVRPISSHQEPTSKPRPPRDGSGCKRLSVPTGSALRRGNGSELVAAPGCLSSRQNAAASIRQAAMRPAPGRVAVQRLRRASTRSPACLRRRRAPPEARAAVDRSDQRDEAVGGEEDMANVLPGPAQHIGKAQLDVLAACQQMPTIRAG